MLKKEQLIRKGQVLHETNPFVPQVFVKSKRITNKRGDMSLVNNETGQITTNIAGFWETKEVDSDSFVKLFVNGVKALAELSSSGTKVFHLLYLNMQQEIGKDKVYLGFSLIDTEKITLSKTTYSKGIKELVSKEFIAPLPAIGWYWVNPNFIWNGDRLAFVKEYYKVSKS